MAELYLKVDQLKVGEWLRGHKSVSTSMITPESLAAKQSNRSFPVPMVVCSCVERRQYAQITFYG